MSIRTLLVDDEPIALRGLARRLRSEPDFELIGCCEDGAAAIAAIGELRPDLVFLDIQMPEISGFEVISAIGLERMPSVIFVTAFDQYAVRAFDVHALDYLLKPIDGERFRCAIERVRQQQRQPKGDLAQQLSMALQALGLGAQSRWSRRLAIKSNGRILLVELTDVDRIEAAGNYVEIYWASKKHLLRETLTSLQARLNPTDFVRISRSSIVNTEGIRELQPMFNGDFVLILRDGTEVSGSRRYREALMDLLGIG